jgi:teichuronic acid biosynthesis glycosyltransferase TuaG
MHKAQERTPPHVAVVIPYFNAARYIGVAIESVLAQTYGPVDVILVDDGSTDDLEGAIAEFRNRVTVITQPNSGQGAARNRGIAEATGAAYVAFLDADDRWHSEKTARQVALLESQPECALVHTAIRLIDSTAQGVQGSLLLPVLNRPARDRCLRQLIDGNSIIVSSVMVRRSVLEDEPFATDISGVEDWDMWIRLAARTRFAYIDEPLIDYRVHDANFSWDKRAMARATVKLFDGVVRRERDRAVRLAAAANRRAYVLEVAHLEFESGNLREARRWFRDAFPRVGVADLARYAATYVPQRLYPAARGMWRALRPRRGV